MNLTRRNFLGQAGLAAFALQGGLLHALENTASATVHAPCGTLRGERNGAVRVFRGIPFAEPPVGALRFRAPEPAKPWKGEREATRFAAAAMQSKTGFAQNEDCLSLNVWAPEGKGPFPVFFWIHGGGFVGGRAFDPRIDGAIFAQAGIVCVTVAYRLGVFSFLNMEPLLGSSYAGSSNNGVRDLICALGWVQKNIAAFGGDPRQVSIGGQSAGAKLTCILMGTPSAHGLFHQMVSESGGADRVHSHQESERVAEGFGRVWKEMGGSPHELLTAPAGKLIEAQERFMASWPQHFPLRAAVDGRLLPRFPLESIASGSTRGKRLLIGTMHDESAAFIGPHPAHDPVASDLGSMALEPFLEKYKKYRELYPQMSDELRRIRAVTAEEYWIPSLQVVEAHMRGGGEAWMYRFDATEDAGHQRGLAPHSFDMRFFWKQPSDKRLDTEEKNRLAHRAHATWAAFLRGKTPAAEGLPVWPRYSRQKRETMLFNTESRVEERPAEAERKLWEKQR